MKNIKPPSDGTQGELFGGEGLDWWATELSPNALVRLKEGWQGVFRRSILKLLPAEKLGEEFSDSQGRPSKELYAMAGLMLISEFKNYTIDQAAEAYAFDASIQYALNLPRNGQYVSPRTVDNYRQKFRNNELAQGVFQEVASQLASELELDITRQRLDSTHVLSNMARLSRHQLLAVGVRRFLVQLNRHDHKIYKKLPKELRERYLPGETQLFGGSRCKKEKRKEAIAQIGEDMVWLVDRFCERAAIVKMKSYQNMKRLLEEHFQTPEDKGGRPQLRPRSKDKDGGSTRTLQNPSDEEAGYNGKKGSGYQAQIAQSLPPRDEDGQKQGPGLITALVPQSAAVRDNEALAEVLAQQQVTGLMAREMTADTIYGSDVNVEYCAGLGVELISPVGGKKPSKQEPKHNCSKQERARKERLQARREAEETEEWKKRYSPRAGIEGLNRALDQVTGFKRLRGRGKVAVESSLYLKAAGWNIGTAAKILNTRQKQQKRMESTQPGHGINAAKQLLEAFFRHLALKLDYSMC